jgi:hypothetical protein
MCSFSWGPGESKHMSLHSGRSPIGCPLT